MVEEIGNFLWKNNFSTFSLSYKRSRLEYFHTVLSILKLTAIALVIFYFKLYDCDHFLDLILLAFFCFVFFIFSTQLLSLYYKPIHNIVTYNRSKNILSIKINHFKTITLKISDIESIIVENIKEGFRPGGGHAKVYRYMSAAYCIDIEGNKYEMFVVNPTDIVQKGEDKTTYELKKISSKICDKISFILDIKTEYTQFKTQ